MIRMTLADYAKIHGQAKAASDFGVIQCAISKAILAGRNIMVTVNVTNGAIVIHTQRLKSDPGGNLLS
ncbi:TPA: Cro/Cl family transcriptional regulator [Escherichia coli]|nr:Cro/Cl family transcriptional regulator [Escherichia coli]